LAQLVVRNLDEALKARLQKRARRHGRSTEEEVREILRSVVGRDREKPRALGSVLAARFASRGLTEGIEEIRGSPVRPARFRP
jgi:plasmid stability protein